MRLTRPAVSSFVAVAVAASTAFADSPLVFVHQGRLLDGADKAVDGELDFTVRFHRQSVDAEGQNNLVWEQKYAKVRVANGFYALRVGDTTGGAKAIELGDWDGVEKLWMGISIGDGSELTPRMRVGSVPFALHASETDRLGGLDATKFARAEHPHKAADITDFTTAAAAAVASEKVPWTSVSGVAQDTSWPGTTAWSRVSGRPDEWPGTTAWARVSGTPDEWSGTAAWDRVTGRPAKYPAESHTHTVAEITGFDAAASSAARAAGVPWSNVTGTDANTSWPGTTSWDRIASKPSTFPPATHTHSAADLGSALVGATVGGKLTAQNLASTSSVTVANDTATCDASKKGAIRFDGTNFGGCDGSAWRILETQDARPVMIGTSSAMTIAAAKAAAGTTPPGSTGGGTICSTGYHVCHFFEAVTMKYAYPRNRLAVSPGQYYRTLGNYTGFTEALTSSGHNSVGNYYDGGNWNGKDQRCPASSGPMLYFYNATDMNNGYEWDGGCYTDDARPWLCCINRSY